MSASISTYSNLVTSEHSDKAKFMAVIAASCQPFVDAQNQLFAMPGLYDVDTAVGVQLDSVGLWVGVSRYVNVPLSGWFSWNTSGLGWGQGIWHQPLTPTDGAYALDDDTFRLLIKARIIANAWDGSIAGAMPALAELFSGSETPGTAVSIQDNMNMTMTLTISGQSPGPLFVALAQNGELGLKPAGVSVNFVNTSL